MTVLMFAYHFPPENAIGGLRPFRFTRYLPAHGFNCHVITAADVSGRPDLPAQTVPDPFLHGERTFLTWQMERAVRKFLLPGVMGVGWSVRAARAGGRFIGDRKDIVLFSTYPPLGTHLAAHRLARRFGLRWIADFRDPLARNPAHDGLGAHSKVIYAHIERHMVAQADICIANTDEAQRLLRSKYPKYASKIVLLWNGFDPAERVDPLALPVRARRVLSHVGELYEGRTAAPLIAAWAKLVGEGKLSSREFLIQLIGPAAASCLPAPEEQRKAEAQGWLSVVAEQIPKAEAQHVAQQSDALIIVQPHSAVQVPGKLFEYLQIGRPILAYVPRHSSIEGVLSRSGVPYVCVYAGEELERGILEFMHLPSEPVKPSDWFEQTFNVETQTAALAAMIRDAAG